MNVLALVSAIVGLGILIAVVIFGNKIKNRWLRYLAVIVGIVLGIGVTGNIPPLLGDKELATSAKAGEYFLLLGIMAIIIKIIFFKNKKVEEGNA